MLLSTIAISGEENRLLSVMQELGFGELFDVEIADQPKTLTVEVSENAASLVDLIRSGVQDIAVITVHQGEPVLAEVDEVNSGFRCRKRIKFPTR